MHINKQFTLYFNSCLKKNTIKEFIEKKKVERLIKLDFHQLINFSQNGVLSDLNYIPPESSGGLTNQVQLTEPLG